MGIREGHKELVGLALKDFSSPVRLDLAFARFDIGHLARIASFRASDQHHVQLNEISRSHVNANHEFLLDYFNKGKIIYGVNTGYGGSADVITQDAIVTQKALIQHLNVGISSQTLPAGIVKAIMLVRANSLSLARSGVRGEVIDLLCSMINHDIVPVVPLRGTVSSSGDLMCLSYIAACMNGSKKDSLVYYKGVRNVTAEEAFEKAGLSFVEFHHKEALAVVNSASCSSTLASDNLFHFGYLMLLTQVVTAMCVEALHGRMESFDTFIYDTLSHVGIAEVSENIRSLLEDSKLVRSFEGDYSGLECLEADELAQDRYGLRTSPQWLSPVVETYMESVRRIRVEINSTCDNPLVDHKAGKIIHGGNFQGVSVTVAMDQTRQGVQMCGRLMFAQLSEVLNHNMNLILTPNLAGRDHCVDFGFKGVDTALAAYASELDSIANPMTNHVLSAEMHNQSVNSMALVSARKTKEAMEILKLIVASSLVALCQALDLRWLRMQVFEALESTLEQFGVHSPACEKTMKKNWYEVAFRFDVLKGDLDLMISENSLKENAKTREMFLTTLKAKCEESVQDVYEGKNEQKIAALLGKGTKQVYNFVRKEVGVKFYKGLTTLDEDCQRLHDVLDSDQMRKLIQDVFSI